MLKKKIYNLEKEKKKKKEEEKSCLSEFYTIY